MRLLGQIDGRPKAFVKRGAEQPYKMEIMLKTLTRMYSNSNLSNRNYDIIKIRTKNPEMMEKIQALHEDDIVAVKGVFCSIDIHRSWVCESCDNEIEENGKESYVHPVHIMLIQSFFDNKGERISSHEYAKVYGRRIIEENIEISNECILDGRVVKDVSYFEGGKTENGNKIPENANYVVRVKRTFRIAEDPVDRKDDYPVVCSYDEQARSDHENLYKGSRINVRGSIRVRSFEKTNMCPQCGYIFKTNETVAEVVASSVQYTHNYASEEAD